MSMLDDTHPQSPQSELRSVTAWDMRIRRPSAHGAEPRGIHVPPGNFERHGRFGRLFHNLRARRDVAPFPTDLGLPGGPMDGGAAPNAPQQNNPRIPAGYTFLGQFLDHDLTLDLTSSLEQQNDPGAVHNFRTAAFELDSLYGAGPGAMPYLYDRRGDFGRLLLVEYDNGTVELPRNEQHVALIGDPRNDENLIVSQLHAAFARFHNEVLEHHAQGEGQLRFEDAQRLVRWHYQWMILNDFLERTVGKRMVDDVLEDGPRVYNLRPHEEAFIPVEFSVAAYRFGHSQVRPGYLINTGFAAPLFPQNPGAALAQKGERNRDLRGNQTVEDFETVDWTNFFKFGAKEPQPGKKIDPKLNTVLLNLPHTVVPEGVPAPLRSLAVRNLQRSITMGLPSGQEVARAMRIRPLAEEKLWEDAPRFRGAPAPLWYYILKESEAQVDPEFNTGGTKLGPVGGRIVTEVFLGLMKADPMSFLNVDPDWKPHLGGSPGHFTMVDLLKVARVVPTL